MSQTRVSLQRLWSILVCSTALVSYSSNCLSDDGQAAVGKTTVIEITGGKKLKEIGESIHSVLNQIRVPDANDPNNPQPLQFRIFVDKRDKPNRQHPYICDSKTEKEMKEYAPRRAAPREWEENRKVYGCKNPQDVFAKVKDRIVFAFRTEDLLLLQTQCSKGEICRSVFNVFGSALVDAANVAQSNLILDEKFPKPALGTQISVTLRRCNQGTCTSGDPTWACC